MKRIQPPPVLQAVEESPTPLPDDMSAWRAACALHMLQPWTQALLVWQQSLTNRAARGSGRGPEWWAAQLREIAHALLRAADLIEGGEGAPPKTETPASFSLRARGENAGG